MVAFNPSLKTAYWGLAGLGGVWVALLSALLVSPAVQKNLLYLHRVRLPIWPDIARPEQLGFAANEVTPFNIATPDNETLFSWHILPHGVYAKNRDELLQRDVGLVDDITETLGFKLLKEDPEARLLIFFHGNAGNVAQGYRTEAFRTWAGVDSNRLHILTFDYRGFGRSTGDPSEAGLILDAVTVLKFAINTIGIDPARIVILGHSLGTAVTLGAAEIMAREHGVEFGGLILCSAFSKLKTLIMTYTIGGVIPILSPLRPYPIVQKWATQYVREPWDGEERLKSLIQHSPHLKLTMIHAHNDYSITWTHSQILFHTAANAIVAKTRRDGASASEGEIDAPLKFSDIERKKLRTELGDEGWVDTWVEGVPEGGWRIEHRLIRWGGHDQVIASSPVKLVIRQMLAL
ncbi:hypothetical protein ABW19_dt0202400 [Dactylella cylindrospora]|nr:hypothetical protein ABW19_dt0202400 [Dactylella cylindrospora]